MGLEVANGVDVTYDGADIDCGAEGHQGDSPVDGCAGGVDGGVGGECRLLLEFAEEEAEACDCEAYAHESEAGADPGEEGALFGEVGSGIVVYVGHIGLSYVLN